MQRWAGWWLFCLAVQLLAACAHSMRPVFRVPRDAPTTGRCTVVVKASATEEEQHKLVSTVLKVADDAKVYGYVDKVAKAFTVKLSPYAVEIVRRLPLVEYIEEEGIAEGVQDVSLKWHIDRLDQARLPLDLQYNPIGDGEGVDVYILDSGINYNHEEFEHRAKYAGYDPVDAYEETVDEEDLPGGEFKRRYGADCHGHGTHVASLSGGKNYGSAKKATIYSIRVLQCTNAAPWSTVLDGLDYLSRITYERGRPAIASLSLGGSYYQTINDAMETLYRQGIPVISAAGNGVLDSCYRSPASSYFTLTVGGSRDGDRLYTLGSGTNYGSCVDIFAPGQSILSADYSCTNCSFFLSGTSMSTPIVSGVAAIHLSRQPLLTPYQLFQKIINESIKDALNFTGIPKEAWADTPNRLLHIQGSCGGTSFVRSRAILTSPGYPSQYPPNLDCQWVLTGDEGQNVQLNFTHVNLQRDYDRLYLYDGYCCNETNLLKMFTGDYGQEQFSYRSSGNTLTLVLKTDVTDGAQGFRAVYTKLYVGTDLKVPDPDITLPTPVPPDLRPPAHRQTLVFYRSKVIRSFINQWSEQGYSLAWASSYKVGIHPKAYYDVVLHNSSEVKTRGFVELGPEQLNQKIVEMRAAGLSLRHISCRMQKARPYRSLFAAIFDEVPDIIETEVYLQESLNVYLARLKEQKNNGYLLITHCFAHRPEDGGRVEVSSVYTRDRRVSFNITVPPPPQWESYYNITFYAFTDIALRLSSRNIYLTSLDVWNYEGDDIRNPESFFACVFTEGRRGSQWFRWGLNTTEANDMVARNRDKWDTSITTGYGYGSTISHYVEFKRRQLF